MRPSTQTIRPGTTKSTTLSGFLLSVQDGEKNPIRVRVFNQIVSGKKIPVMQKIPVHNSVLNRPGRRPGRLMPGLGAMVCAGLKPPGAAQAILRHGLNSPGLAQAGPGYSGHAQAIQAMPQDGPDYSGSPGGGPGYLGQCAGNLNLDRPFCRLFRPYCRLFRPCCRLFRQCYRPASTPQF